MEKKGGKLTLSFKSVDEESEPDIEDFIVEFKEFGLYVVNGGNHQKFLVGGMMPSELGNRDLAVLYDTGCGETPPRRRGLDKKASAAVQSRNPGARSGGGCGDRGRDVGLRKSRKDASMGPLP